MIVKKLVLLHKVDVPGHVPPQKDFFVNIQAEEGPNGITIAATGKDRSGLDVFVPWHLVKFLHRDRPAPKPAKKPTE